MSPTPGLAPEAAAFYATQSPFSDPGDLVARYADLPRDVGELARVARDLMIHRQEGDLFAHAIPSGRMRDSRRSTRSRRSCGTCGVSERRATRG
ncbi:hypothetical protein ACGFW5_00800 [Streptomyces sp. NPDC048416]|uniref:hypothetical protein n=1 Tax=Streptomyces sp. NPDC048416 TaxID=3365546 RepID=UPI0037154545